MPDSLPVTQDMLEETLRRSPRRWLVTGGAGFIGSHLVESLLNWGQEVTCLDNFSKGKRENLDAAIAGGGGNANQRLRVVEGDITDPSTCQDACRDIDHVLHQAALGSVPASIEDPLGFHRVNVTGTVNVFNAAREAGITRVVYASSSAVYGDAPTLPKIESKIGAPLSPYAASKLSNELWARTFAQCYGMEFVGLRYFNVYGPHQDPKGAYAAVIPAWMNALITGDPLYINGDGTITRDFVSVADVVRANLLGSLAPLPEDEPALALNVGTGRSLTLTELARTLIEAHARLHPDQPRADDPIYRDFREGDIPHSWADPALARESLGFSAQTPLIDGLAETLEWYHQETEN